MTVAAEPAAPKLTVRRPKLDFSNTPKYWVLDDPQATHALNILQLGIPAGERYFIDSIRLATRYITDATLLADARSFIGQESVHARMPADPRSWRSALRRQGTSMTTLPTARPSAT